MASPPKRRRGQRGPDRKPRQIRSDAQTCIATIEHLISDPARNAGWLSTMRAAKENAPRCTSIRKNGMKCERVAVKGSAHCCRHMSFAEQRRIDDARYIKAQQTIDRLASPTIVERARRVMLTIERRRLLALWSRGGGNQAEVPGMTITLSHGDSVAVANLLKNLSQIDIFDQRLTPRCIDRCRWAAYLHLIGKLDFGAYDRRIKNALRREAEYWSMKNT